MPGTGDEVLAAPAEAGGLGSAVAVAVSFLGASLRHGSPHDAGDDRDRHPRGRLLRDRRLQALQRRDLHGGAAVHQGTWRPRGPLAGAPATVDLHPHRRRPLPGQGHRQSAAGFASVLAGQRRRGAGRQPGRLSWRQGSVRIHPTAVEDPEIRSAAVAKQDWEKCSKVLLIVLAAAALVIALGAVAVVYFAVKDAAAAADAMARLKVVLSYEILILTFFYGLMVLLYMASGKIDLSMLLSEPKGNDAQGKPLYGASMLRKSAKKFPAIPSEILVLLGISASTYAVGKGIQSSGDGGSGTTTTTVAPHPAGGSSITTVAQHPAGGSTTTTVAPHSTGGTSTTTSTVTPPPGTGG